MEILSIYKKYLLKGVSQNGLFRFLKKFLIYPIDGDYIET